MPHNPDPRPYAGPTDLVTAADAARHAAEGFTTGAPCAPCQAKSDAYQARLEYECPYGRSHDGGPCSACTDS